MSTALPRSLLRIAYYEAAQAYLRSLPPEHFMEATTQATQREITLESLALVKARRPDFHVFNELLVQYPLSGKKIGQVVPDNMVVRHEGPLEAEGSYDTLFEPERPFWTLEYVSKSNKRKDYEESFRKYERGLKVPYYLVFYPDAQELTLYHHNRKKYVSVKPNAQGRYAIPEVELELALVDGWVRYWYQGELLPLPADMQRELDETRRRLADATRRAEEERQRADEERHRADEEKHRADEERQARLAAERELAELRAQVRQPHGRPRKKS